MKLRNRKKTIFFIILAIITLTISSVIFWQSSKRNNEDAILTNDFLTVNEPLPNGELFDELNNSLATDKVKSGKVLLVYLLNGCGACNTEINTISELQESIKQDTKVYGIVSGTGNELNALSKENKSEFTILLDKDNKLRKSLGIRYFPLNLLVKDGVIVKKWLGIKDKEDLLEKLKD